MGGYVAMAVLRAAPSLVAGLVLVDTRAAADTSPARENRLVAAHRADTEGVDWIPDAMLPALLGATTLSTRGRRWWLPFGLDHWPQDPAAVAWLSGRWPLGRIRGLCCVSLTCRALVVRGAEDELIPSGGGCAGWAVARGGGGRVSGAAHLPPLETPVEFTSNARSWLAG